MRRSFMFKNALGMVLIVSSLQLTAHAATFRENIEAASKAFDAEDYEAAAEAYLAAAESKPDSVIVQYNLGLCYQVLGRNASAAEAFRNYLTLSPDASDKGTVQRWISQLESSKAVPNPEKTSRPETGSKPEKKEKDGKAAYAGEVSAHYFPATLKVSWPGGGEPGRPELLAFTQWDSGNQPPLRHRN